MTTTEHSVARKTAVWLACNAMAERGEKPTMRLVRAHGVPGSPKDIQSDVNEWFSHIFRSHTAALKVESIPKTLHETLNKFWDLALQEAKAQFNHERTELQQQITEAQATAQEKAALLDQANQALSTRNQQLESAAATNDALNDQLTAAGQLQARLEQEQQKLRVALDEKASDLERQLRENDVAIASLTEAHRQEIQSLNETHAHSIESLTQTHTTAVNQLNLSIESQNDRIAGLESKLTDQQATAKKEEELLRAELKNTDAELKTALAEAAAAKTELVSLRASNEQYQAQLANTQALLEKSIQSIATLAPPAKKTPTKKGKAPAGTER